jgi:hypothetical protein
MQILIEEFIFGAGPAPVTYKELYFMKAPALKNSRRQFSGTKTSQKYICFWCENPFSVRQKGKRKKQKFIFIGDQLLVGRK